MTAHSSFCIRHSASCIRHSFVIRIWSFVILLCSSLSAQQGLIPTNPQPRTDSAGNIWYLEQNGMLSRQGGGNSILSGSMMLMVGTEQFYCNQPMGTPDGRELVLTGQQPMMGGLQVTRHIRFLDKEGGVRYLELFTNTTARDITATVEIRHNFSGQVKSVLTDTGRAQKGTFEKNEGGLVVVPGSAGYNGFLYTVCGPRSAVKPRIASQNQYQLSLFYTITVPPGKGTGLLHTVTQGKLSLRPDADELGKLFKPFALARHLRDLPKGTAALLSNLRGASTSALDLAAWFPEEILGVTRESVDVLAMGEGTRLRGKASCARLTLTHRLGTIVIPWENVLALAGGRSGAGEGRIHLADGQVLRGRWEAEELRFTLNSGLAMALQPAEVDRLVLASAGGPPVWPPGVAALLETGNGERLALREADSVMLALSSTWGSRMLKLGEVAAITSTADEGTMPLATLRDGSRFRVWLAAQGALSMETSSFGKQSVQGSQIRSLAVASAVTAGAEADAAGEDAEPTTAFADLAGEQRLVAPVANARLHLITSGGAVPLEPAGIKELRNVSEDIKDGLAGADDAPWFQVELWGGGSVLGQLRESAVTFRVAGAEWHVPAAELMRFVNPVPTLADTTLTRIGQLLRDLGHDDWKTREKASGELRTLGIMARPALQEALKQSEDAEVKRRIETILGELE